MRRFGRARSDRIAVTSPVSLTRYWHTLRHLRPVQFYGRAWFRLARPRPNLSPPPPLCTPDGAWQRPAQREPSQVGPDTFLFLKASGSLSEVGWDGPEREKLWRYNQHYFDDLNARDCEARADWHRALLVDWVDRNPPGTGNGWEPYPTSLRIVNWVKWALAGNALPESCVNSLAVQARWLTKRLEFHLLGNHLFANAKALVFAGLFFNGEEANGWLRAGLRILQREVPEQILPDGGHFERSTMYHALAVEDMLDLINLSACYQARFGPSQKAPVSAWGQRARAIHAWLHVMCHPDGEIAFFNDAAFDVAPSVAQLDAYAHRLLPGLQSVPAQAVVQQDSGYVRLTRGNAVALLDVAPVGPDYLPGHAHADTLTFELSLGKQRVLVNSGTSCYGTSPERLRQRGSAAHNTVVVDGKDSSEVWGGFRVARRAYPIGLRVQHTADAATSEVTCAHNGYARLPGKPVHHRTWRMNDEGLIVNDRVEGQHQTAEARFHFHPGLQVQMDANAASGSATLPDGTTLTWHLDLGQARLEPSSWHPRFGESWPNVCLIVGLVSGASSLRFCWASSKASSPDP